VEVADPQGRNPKRRPAVIVTPNDDIAPDGVVRVVAISTRIEEAPPDVQVELPWDARDGEDTTAPAELGRLHLGDDRAGE
jgi:mRNA-degrading endonuclease toxin of MazEF toxin-antitoxin module